METIKIKNKLSVGAPTPADLAHKEMCFVEPSNELYIKKANNEVKLLNPQTIIQQIGGQYLLDPNEYNGWGITGFTDDTNNQDLGNVGSNNLNRVSGGLTYPFDVRIKSFKAYHYNSNVAALPWGWFLARIARNANSNTVTTTWMLDEAFDRGNGQFNLRNYLNNRNQTTELSNFENNIVPAGEIIILGVGAPTAVTTNYYVRVSSGYLEIERV